MSRDDDVSPAKATVILDKPSHWDEWLFILKDKAVDLDIWQYIEPTLDDKTGKPLPLPVLPPTKPTIPRVKDVKSDAETVRDLDPNGVQALKALQATYKDDEKVYQEYLKARKEINDFIMRTVSLSNHIYMRNSDGVRQKIIDLKKHLAPTDEARELELSTLYSQLKKAPSNQDIDQWLRRWETTYADAVAIKLPEVQEKRPVYDFLGAVQSLDAGFASTQRALIYSKIKNPTLYDIVEEFRNTRRLTVAREKAETHSAFATFKGLDDGTTTVKNSAAGHTDNHTCTHNDNDASTDSAKGSKGSKDKSKSKCAACDAPYHDIYHCYHANEAIRPKDWTPNEKRAKVFQDRLAKDSAIAAIVAKIRQGLQGQANIAAAVGAINSEKPSLGVFTAAAYSVNQDEYKLKNHWIIDSGSDAHVCNSQDSFTRTRNALQTDQLISGKTVYKIEAFGTVEIDVRSPQGIGQIMLIDVAYIPGFMTNLVSLSRLVARGVH